jgi:DNA recombination protein RmuC
MEPIHIVLIAAIIAAAFGAAAVLLMKRSWSRGRSVPDPNEQIRQLGAEVLGLRDAKAELERRFAVEEQKAVRIPELERTLAERLQQIDALRDGKATAERGLAAAGEALTQIRKTLAQEEARAAALAAEIEGLNKRHEMLRQEKSKLDEVVAAKTETIVGMEAAATDLRRRLEVAEHIRDEVSARNDTLKEEMASLQKLVAEKTALLEERTSMAEALRQDLDEATAARDAAARESSDWRSRQAKLQETLDQVTKQSDEKLALLAEARERMTKEFRILADEVMKRHGDSFTKQNKEQMDGILTPLRDRLTEFQQGLQMAQTESARERATLKEQIRALTESSAKMTQETHNLTRALKGKAQAQGAWGEMVLSTILEHSGLREGEEYVTQESHSNESGQRLRPDVVVNLPNAQRIVIDSKVSLTAFEAFVNAETDAERPARLKAHLGSMRTHIRSLAGKDYQAASGSRLDYVIMFVPIEGALAVALQADPALTGFAAECNVAIATPTTLMIALRTVANVWQVERRNRNAELIADRAGKLYDKFVGFLDDMGDMGVRLAKARESYDCAMGKLSTGRGSLVKQVEYLRELGAKTSKAMPQNLLDEVSSGTLPAPRSGAQAVAV